MTEADRLNADSDSSVIDKEALKLALLDQGDYWYGLVHDRCPHLFAEVPVFVSSEHLRNMSDLIHAVENVTGLVGWQLDSYENPMASKGVFYGYDFHVSELGVQLIEINTNAGGAFINGLLIESQRNTDLPGNPTAIGNLEIAFLEMFRREWNLEKGSADLRTFAIVDDQPENQYLYPEFLLAQRLLERDGIRVHILDPKSLTARLDGLYSGDEKIDMVYNRLTDFSLHQYPLLLESYLKRQVVLTPSPVDFTRYADKRNLVRLTNAKGLRLIGAKEADIATLQAYIPATELVSPEIEDRLWSERKHWFFKPYRGYGSKGAYRGGSLTKRVFAEIMQGEYVAQKMAKPAERALRDPSGALVMLKYDVRCFAYDGKIQLVAARLYQGQTTNFRTPGGGFAIVRAVE